jgi:hypothetical protein
VDPVGVEVDDLVGGEELVARPDVPSLDFDVSQPKKSSGLLGREFSEVRVSALSRKR